MGIRARFYRLYQPIQRHDIRKIFAIALFYGLLIFVMTLPASVQLVNVHNTAKSLLGEDIDIWIFYWNNWWVERAVQEGHSWFFTPYIFYPQGTSLLTHSNAFANAVLALAMRPFMGAINAYNFVVLFGLWIGAMGMFWLVDTLTHRKAAALFAGFVFTFAPYHLTQALAHGHLGSIHWWPYYALFLHHTLTRDWWPDVILTALFAALTFWSGLQLAIMLMLWSVIYVGWYFIVTLYCWARSLTNISSPSRWVKSRFTLTDTLWLQKFWRLLSIGVLTGLLCSPELIPLIQERDRLVDAASDFDQSDQQQTDIVAYVLPPHYNPAIGKLTEPVYQNFPLNYKYIPYIGYAVGIMAILAIIGCQREKWFWLMSAGLWIVLAAGPSLRINGQYYAAIRLPYDLIKDVFPISTLRSSDRFNLLVVFSLSVLAGFGIAELMAWSLKRRGAGAGYKPPPLLLLGLLVLFEYWCAPLPMTAPPPASPFLKNLAHDGEIYALVDCPMGYRYGKWWVYYQTLHGKPIVEGHLSRYTSDTYAFIASEPLLRVFYRKSDRFPLALDRQLFEGDLIPASALGPALRSLDEDGVRYIVFHKAYFSSDLYDVYRERFPCVPLYEDDRIEVYDIRQPFPFYYGVLDPSVEFSDRDLSGGGLFLDHLEIQEENGGRDWRFRFIVHASKEPVERAVCRMVLIKDTADKPIVHYASAPVSVFEPLPGGWMWRADDVGYYEITTRIPVDLAPDMYHWRLVCSASAVETQNAPRSRGGASLQQMSPFVPSSMAGLVPATSATLEKHDDGRITYLQEETPYIFGDSIRLRGYRWEVRRDTLLHVELLWEALKAPSQNYKVFVHLLDQAGNLVGQYDAEPCDWQCPTGIWEAGQRIRDKAEIPVGGLLPGVYQLKVGLYDAATMDRLSIVDPRGVVPGEAVPLSRQLIISDVPLP